MDRASMQEQYRTYMCFSLHVDFLHDPKFNYHRIIDIHVLTTIILQATVSSPISRNIWSSWSILTR